MAHHKGGDLDDWIGLFHELKDADDRSAAILAGESVSQELRVALGKLCGPDLSEKVREEFLEMTFARRAIASRALGIISARTYGAVRAIIKIRNAFAHGLHGLSFDTQEIVELAGRLPAPAIASPAGPHVRSAWPAMPSRDRYLHTCAIVRGDIARWVFVHAVRAHKARERAATEAREGGPQR
jgi:hypothetical protein